ncbi:hypothetical protein EV11_1507 [Prochlorococcus sp. SS52]|nr:hypothetical protein EV08_1388 [Prochlorococcus marinus str. SS2]KGG23561.1 hypothetical protein EV09_1185 [Prochlorococcus marinus str. SS35]KGG32203.1 hypothetical protein EV10_1318 [Prochlorococcus marinus str. SS51]KGG35105.1 hypothetical protein EV11_1507 [Prochlorococcus sp. SS52]
MQTFIYVKLLIRLLFRNANLKLLNTDSARFKTINASIGDMSSPPIAGIIPLNRFK